MDRPAEGKVLIAPAGYMGTNTKPVYQQAAEAYLAGSGRRCSITDGYQVVSITWEFVYRCEGSPIETGALKR
jgi:hypothetical protein